MPGKRPTDELCDLLVEQYGLLQSSALSFDRGNEAEALRLATTVRVLVHDTSQSHSLVGQLGTTDRLWVSDTSFLPFHVGGMDANQALTLIHKVLFPQTALVTLGPGLYVPHCATYDTRMAPQRPFADWWSASIASDPGNFKVTRKQLVLDLANREGGAHVDRRPPRPWFEALDRTNFEGWEQVHGAHPSDPDFGSRPGVAFDGSVARASMRQVADEVLVTLLDAVRGIKSFGVKDPEAWGIFADVPEDA
jgi:hypothetical protein